MHIAAVGISSGQYYDITISGKFGSRADLKPGAFLAVLSSLFCRLHCSPVYSCISRFEKIFFVFREDVRFGQEQYHWFTIISQPPRALMKQVSAPNRNVKAMLLEVMTHRPLLKSTAVCNMF